MTWLTDSQGILIRSTLLGFRNDAVGALSGSWASSQGLTPRDIAVQTSGGMNVAWEPTTAVVSPFFYWTTPLTQTMNFRMSGAVRTKSAAGTGKGRAFFGIQYNASTSYLVYVQVHGASQYIGLDVVGGTTVHVPAAITANLWYQIGIEKVGNTLRGLWNPTPQISPASFGSDTLMTEFATFQIASLNLTPSQTYPFISTSNGAASATDFEGVADVTFMEFNIPTVAAATPGVGGFAAPNPTPYFTYKNLRQAVSIYNNLVVGP